MLERTRLPRPFIARIPWRARALVIAVVAAAWALLLPTTASAHAFDASTISVHLKKQGPSDASISIALQTLGQAMETELFVDVDGAEITAYLDEHLTITGADGTVWPKTWSTPTLEKVEGIDSVTVDVSFAPPNGGPATGFVFDYDAVIAEFPDHAAVVVLTDTGGQVSTAGVLTKANSSLTIADSTTQTEASTDNAANTTNTSDTSDTSNTGMRAMLTLGYSHVLKGADHLFFLSALLLPAPLLIVAGRWANRGGFRPTLRRVAEVVTSFTIGHSITLIAASLGWVKVPTTVIETLVAVSVAVAAIHAIRPLVVGGDRLIAGGFGLVHGLAFAGILAEQGLVGTTSLPSLLAFNVGVELAQLTVVALVFPSLYAMSRTQAYTAVRVTGASLALAAAVGWIVDRLGIVGNPFASIEAWLIDHPWWIVIGLAALAAILTKVSPVVAPEPQSEPEPPSSSASDRGKKAVKSAR